MCGSRWRGQEPSAKYFALDPSERLTVGTYTFESTVLVVCQSIERWDWDFSALTNSPDALYRQELVSCFNAKQ